MDWNACYERRETPWDRGYATPVLDEVLARHPALFQGRIMVPGCGAGHDARWLAARGCQVTGVDVAPLALERARAQDPSGSVDFVEASLFALPQSMQHQYDLVWEHTCLSALDPAQRSAYAQGIRTALKPGGIVAGVFFINPELDPGETGPPFGISGEELDALWHQAGFHLVDSWVPETGYEGRVGRERVLVAISPS